MSSVVFFQVLNMSYTASFVILFVLAARLFLKPAPKVYSYALWGVVLFRLVCPVSVQSSVSLLPNNPTPFTQQLLSSPSPQLQTGFEGMDQLLNQALSDTQVLPEAGAVSSRLQAVQMLWLAGMAVLLIHGLVSFVRLRRQLRDATPEKGNLYRTERFSTPFVLGIWRPRIYLPASLEGKEKAYILLHEQIHIRRGDHIFKLPAFLVLCIHWFNPLVWAAFFLWEMDMEMSCDEAAIKVLGYGAKKRYSFSLLHMATGRRIIGGTPLAFGEGNPKKRIQNILRYRAPGFWAAVVAVLAVAALGIGLAVNLPVTAPYTPRDPQEAFENFTAEKDYSGISVTDASGKDITDIAIDLWWAANGVYDPDDVFVFEMGPQTTLLENAPDFYELINYAQVMPTIFKAALTLRSISGLGIFFSFSPKAILSKTFR